MNQAAPLSMITSGKDRLKKESTIKCVVLGPDKIGKTTLVKTLPAEETLFFDLEGGMLALDGPEDHPDWLQRGWSGDSISARQIARLLMERNGAPVTIWEIICMVTTLICGPDPSEPPASKFSMQMHAGYKSLFPGMNFDKYNYVFVDSITDAAEHAFKWCLTRPEAVSERTGNVDTRGAYGLVATELVSWFKMWQLCADRSVILVGGLNVKEDENIPGRMHYSPMLTGSKAADRINYVFDEVLTLGLFTDPDPQGNVQLDLRKGVHRAFVSQRINPFGLPAADRSGRLDLLEPADLGAVFAKIRTGKRREIKIDTQLGHPNAASPDAAEPSPEDTSTGQAEQPATAP